MLNQILRDMETEIAKARSQVADMMAQEKIFQDYLTAAQQQSSHMEERAETYVKQGNDAMAREALKRKSDADANVAVSSAATQRANRDGNAPAQPTRHAERQVPERHEQSR